jgi:outer membrane protein assembly factor BamD (BamD/ComL family)
MLRKRLVGACLVVTTALGGTLSAPRAARAQEVIDLDEDAPPAKSAKKGGAKSAGGKKKGAVDIDLDDGADKSGGSAAAGQMTEEAAAAKRLFDKDRFAEAAVALYRVVAGETGDDPGNQQLATYYLAVSLYKLKFYQASYALFSLISMQKTHLKFRETLLWLAKLATQLPDPADIIERVGKYSDEEVARFNNPQQKELFWQLNYMLGRYKYRNRQYEDAVRLFQKVDQESPYYVQSQFFSGISYVQLRKSVPAIKSFQRVEKAVDEGAEGVEDESRMRDLAYLSMARTYYSSSIKLDAETNAPNVNSEKLSAAVKYWNQVDEASEYWLDALFEESWAYFMAGDYPRALGNIHTIQAPYFPGSFFPEADILKAVIYFSNCNYEAATTVVARFSKRYTPLRKELAKVLTHFKGNPEDSYKFLLAVRDGTADLDPSIKSIVENAMSDRSLLRNIEYVKVLDNELDHFKKAPGAFQSSGLGQQVQDALKLARSIAVQNAGKLAKSRYDRNLDDLDEHLRNGEKILIDITAAQRNLLDEKLQQGRVSKAESKIFGVVKPDEEHLLWPYQGEYWRDELGFYRQVVESACGR